MMNSSEFNKAITPTSCKLFQKIEKEGKLSNFCCCCYEARKLWHQKQTGNDKAGKLRASLSHKHGWKSDTTMNQPVGRSLPIKLIITILKNIWMLKVLTHRGSCVRVGDIQASLNCPPQGWRWAGARLVKHLIRRSHGKGSGCQFRPCLGPAYTANQILEQEPPGSGILSGRMWSRGLRTRIRARAPRSSYLLVDDRDVPRYPLPWVALP